MGLGGCGKAGTDVYQVLPNATIGGCLRQLRRAGLQGQPLQAATPGGPSCPGAGRRARSRRWGWLSLQKDLL